MLTSTIAALIEIMFLEAIDHDPGIIAENTTADIDCLSRDEVVHAVRC